MEVSTLVHNCVISFEISADFRFVRVARSGVEIKSSGIFNRKVPSNRLNDFAGIVIGACFGNFGAGSDNDIASLL
jgi:hypothetical protein